MEKLEIVNFENQDIQLYTQNNELLMTMEELAAALGFSNDTSFKNFVNSNPYLLTEEFSFLRKVNNLEGGTVKKREKRFFNEQGIYEAALLARTDKSKKFRKFARYLITKFHKKEILPVSPQTAFIKLRKLDEKLDKIEEILIDRQDTFQQIDETAGKEVELLEKLQKKVEEIDGITERLNLIERKIDQIVDCVNSVIDTLEDG